MNWNLSDPLERAIWDVCEELRVEHEWGVTDNGEQRPPFPDEILPSVLRRFFSPLVIADGFRSARIAALRAELKELEESNAE